MWEENMGYPDTIKTPDLIQRGSFKEIPETEIVGLDSLISYDYMGSSEFEWGALPHSLKRMGMTWSQYTWFPIEDIKDADGQALYVLCRKNQQAEITEAVRIIAAESYCAFHTKEHVGLHEYITCKSTYAMKTNFWWDVTSDNNLFSHSGTENLGSGNDWMCCFGNNIRRLVIAINKYCEKKEMLLKGPDVPTASNKVIRSEIQIEDDGRKSAVIVKFPDGKDIVILKRRVIEINNEDSGVLKVKVITKSGREKWLEIKVSLSSTRSLLYNMLKDWPKINESAFKQIQEAAKQGGIR
jgi:hypothetical protein